MRDHEFIYAYIKHYVNNCVELKPEIFSVKIHRLADPDGTMHGVYENGVSFCIPRHVYKNLVFTVKEAEMQKPKFMPHRLIEILSSNDRNEL